MVKHHGRAGRDYGHINGVPRNLTPKLTDDELAAMASELKVTRHTDGKDKYQLRLEYVQKNRRG